MLLTSAAAIVLTCSALILYELITTRGESLQQVATLARIVSANSTAALAFRDDQDAQEVLATLRTEPSIVAAALYDADGKPVCVLGVNIEITRRKSLEEQLRRADIQVARLNVFKATMRTVEDIAGNGLMSLQMFRVAAEPHVSPASLEQFDHIINETAAKLKALSDLEDVVETDMTMGPGIDYQRTREKS